MRGGREREERGKREGREREEREDREERAREGNYSVWLDSDTRLEYSMEIWRWSKRTILLNTGIFINWHEGEGRDYTVQYSTSIIRTIQQILSRRKRESNWRKEKST